MCAEGVEAKAKKNGCVTVHHNNSASEEDCVRGGGNVEEVLDTPLS